TAPREHATERRHHPTGRIVGSSWFDLALLEERQLFAKEEVLRSQGATGMRRKESQAEQINHDRRDCSEAVCNGSDQRKAWHERSGCTLQNVTGSRFWGGRTFCGGHHIYNGQLHSLPRLEWHPRSLLKMRL